MTASSTRLIQEKAEKLIESIGLGGEKVKRTVTPGLKPTNEQIDGEKEVEQHERTPYRGNGVRCNYLGLDRPEIQYSANEICRLTSSPTNIGQEAPKRLCLFLICRKRLVFRYPWQRASTV